LWRRSPNRAKDETVQLDAHLERLIECDSRDELMSAVTEDVGHLIGTDGVRVAELTMVPKVRYRVLQQNSSGSDPTPSMVSSPLNHPIIAHYYHTHFSGWVSVEDLLPGRAWTEHPMYREVYAPMRLRSHISTALVDNGPVMYSLSLNRAGRDFSPKERDLLGAYSRLVTAAWERVDDITEDVVTWLNREYVWDVGAVIPGCWPQHPHLVHEIAVLADQRRRAGASLTSDTIEESVV